MSTTNDQIIAVSVAKTAKMIGISRSILYELVKEGEISVVKIKRRTVILRSEIERFLEKCRSDR